MDGGSSRWVLTQVVESTPSASRLDFQPSGRHAVLEKMGLRGQDLRSGLLQRRELGEDSVDRCVEDPRKLRYGQVVVKAHQEVHAVARESAPGVTTARQRGVELHLLVFGCRPRRRALLATCYREQYGHWPPEFEAPRDSGQSGEPAVYVPWLGALDPRAYSLPMLAVLLGALDAFNPCAFFVLLFLLSLLVNTRSHLRMLLVGK